MTLLCESLEYTKYERGIRGAYPLGFWLFQTCLWTPTAGHIPILLASNH